MTPTLNDQITAIEERAAKATAPSICSAHREPDPNCPLCHPQSPQWHALNDMAQMGVNFVDSASAVSVRDLIVRERQETLALCKLARAQDEALRACVEALKEIQFQESLKRKPYPYADMIEAALAAAERLDAAALTPTPATPR